MSIATSNRCLNELAQIQDGGKLASSLLCSKLKSRGALINDMYDDDYDDTELESFDQELHRRYNLMYFVPRSKFNKRDVEVDASENDEEDEEDYEDYEDYENVKFKKRSIVEPLKREPEKQSSVSSSTPTPSPSPPIRQPDTSATPSISTTNSIEKQSTKTVINNENSSSSPPSSSSPSPSSSPSSSPTTNTENVNKTVPVKDALYWWRNDPLINVHHEHWHVVFVNSPVNGTYKDREGENFIYMHRFMLARYDAERYALGVAKVAPVPNYRDPIPDAFYPPSHLYEVVNDKIVHFPSRPPGQIFKDTVVKTEDDHIDKTSYTLKELENALITLEKWIDGEETYLSPSKLLNDPNGNTDLGAVIEDILHNVGHAMLGRVMAPNNTNAPPGVLVGARAGCRDPLFWRWHRHIDDIYVRWQTRLGLNMFSNDIPPIKIGNNDIFLAFKDELFNLDKDGDHNGWVKYAKKTIGGNNFGKKLINVTGFTNELQTTMKQRVHVWLEDTNDKEIVEFMYPREFFTFFRIENLSSKSLPVTFRVFIVPEVFMDSYVHWIELDKFKRILKPYERTIISQDCDQSIGIRKPAQKTIRQMERSTQMTPDYVNSIGEFTLDKQSEAIFCGCGWPYHMVIPRGTKEGLRFKMMVYVSDGKDDLVPVAPTCGSQLLCGGRKWKDKYPDKHPMGYPFDRPFINKSFYQTFAHLPNVAIRDFTIRWVEDFPLLVPLNN